MHIRCPHCKNPVELVDTAEFHELLCPSCGSSFNLLDETLSYRSPGERRRIGQFELIEQLGVGHFGAVWKAHDKTLDRLVAVKMPRREQLSQEESELFLREARAAAQLAHPNIVSVHEVGREQDSIYIVSDYIEGANLRDWLAVKQSTPRRNADLLATIASAIHHAHEAGVVHRDLKPGNIMIDAQGSPHVMDFGLAKRDVGEITMTIDGKILGTPAYMPPEQASGKSHLADRRSDVYSLGVILFEMLTGELPFRGEKRMLLLQIIHDDPPSPHRLNARVAKDLETICLKAMAKEPNHRYQTAEELADDLRRYLEGRPIHARPLNALEQSLRWAKRKPSHALIAGLLLVVACVASYAAVVRSLANSELEKQNGITREALEQSQALSGQLLLERGLNEIDNGNYEDALHWLALAANTDDKAKVAASYNFAAIMDRVATLEDIIPTEMMPVPVNNGLLLTDRSNFAYLDYEKRTTQRISSNVPENFSSFLTQSSAFAPRKNRLVTFVHDKIFVVDTSEDGDGAATPIEVGAVIAIASVTPDAARAAVVSREAEMFVYDIESAELLAGPVSLADHFGSDEAVPKTVSQIAMSEGHIAIIFGAHGDQQALGVWSIEAEDWTEAKIELSGQPTDLAVDNDGQRVAVELDEEIVLLFDIKNQRLYQRPERLKSEKQQSLLSSYALSPGKSLRFSPGGTTLRNAFDVRQTALELVAWDTNSWEPQWRHREPSYATRGSDRAQIANDHVYFRGGRTLQGLRLADGEPVRPLPIGPAGLFGTARTGLTWTFEFSTFERRADDGWDITGALRLWKQPQSRSLKRSQPIQSEIEQLVACEVDSRQQVRLISREYSETEKTLTVRLGKAAPSDDWVNWSKTVIPHDEWPSDLGYSGRRQRFLVSNNSGVRVFAEGSQEEALLSIETDAGELHTAEFSTSGTQVAVLASSEFQLWDIESQEQLRSIELASLSRVLEADISPDLRRVATVDPFGRVTVSSTQTGALLGEIRNTAFVNVAFAPDSESLICWGDRELQSFSPTMTPLSSNVLSKDFQLVDVQISPDGKLLATAGRSGVRLFTFPECHATNIRIDPVLRQLDSIRFSNDGILVLGDDRREGELMNAAKTGVVIQLDAPQPSALTAEQMLELARRRTGFVIETNGARRLLTPDEWLKLKRE